MSVYRKDNQGNIHKLASNLVQRKNDRWFLCTRSVENDIEYYTVPAEASEYFTSINKYTVYSFGFDTPNTTDSPKLRYSGKEYTINDFTNTNGKVNIGQLNGVYQMFTENDTDTIYFCGNSHGDFVNQISADKVILSEDLILAGNYTRVGNITKELDEVKIYPAKGKTLTVLLNEIFAKRVQPIIVKQPSVTIGAGSIPSMVEVGTVIDRPSVEELELLTVFDSGKYSYDENTGVEISDKLFTISGTITSQTGTVENGWNSSQSTFDATEDFSMTIGVQCDYTDGNVAKDNFGDLSDPLVKIIAGRVTASQPNIKSYRKYFYGTTNSTNPPTTNITSDFIRSLTNSNEAFEAGTFNLTVPAGATGVYFAINENLSNNEKPYLQKVINKTALNADVTSTFLNYTVAVKGANNKYATNYKVWYYIPAVAYNNPAELEFTFTTIMSTGGDN